MTVTDTLQLTPARWRLLNHLDQTGTPVTAAALLSAQDAAERDLHWLGDNDLVIATVTGRSTRLDLREHLAHGGSPAAVAVKANARGRRAVSAPQNRLLRQLGATAVRERDLQTLMADTGADHETVAALVRRRAVAVVVRGTGAPITADDLAALPAATITVRLTDKGRAHLPLPARATSTAGPAAPVQRGPGRPGHYNADQPRAADGKWIKVGDTLGYADDENVFGTDRVTGAAGSPPTDLALIQYPDDGTNQAGAFVSIATSPHRFNPVTGREEDTGHIYCAPQLDAAEAETAAGRLEELAGMVESGYRPPAPTKHTRARQRVELLLAEDRAGRRDRIIVGDEEDFPLTTADLLKLLCEADPTLSAPQTRHAVRAHAASAAGGEDGTVWLDMEPDTTGTMQVVVTAVEGTSSPDDDFYRPYAARHTPDSARELAGKLRAFARDARRRTATPAKENQA